MHPKNDKAMKDHSASETPRRTANAGGSATAPQTTEPPHSRRQVLAAIALFAATCASTTYVNGLAYSVPMMTILLSHELGHYIAARIHRVPASPPFFIPLPIPPLGTLGAVIAMPDRIERRNALLDIGAAGPLAGLCVAVPVLIYGIAESPVQPFSHDSVYLLEGHSLLYGGLLWAIKGPIPEGHDIMLSPTALAGWAGLLVTMINLLPAAQLDGGHVAYALFGKRQERYSRRLRQLLPFLALAVGGYYGLPLLLAGVHGERLVTGFTAGMHWLIWWVLLRFIVSSAGAEHPPTNGAALSPIRRRVAIFTLLWFPLLFMPFWMRQVVP